MITQVRLKEKIEYNPITGIFLRKQRPISTFKTNYEFTKHMESINRKKCGWIQNGYLYIYIDNKSYLGHRLAWLYIHGEFPQNEIDHLNHNRSDNKISNLREATHQENCKNRSLAINNKSRVIGVHFSEEGEKWIAYITNDYKNIKLGHFKDFFEAICARKSAEKKYGFHENHGS